MDVVLSSLDFKQRTQRTMKKKVTELAPLEFLSDFVPPIYSLSCFTTCSEKH